MGYIIPTIQYKRYAPEDAGTRGWGVGALEASYTNKYHLLVV